MVCLVQYKIIYSKSVSVKLKIVNFRKNIMTVSIILTFYQFSTKRRAKLFVYKVSNLINKSNFIYL